MANVESTPFSPPNEKIRDGNVNSSGTTAKTASAVMAPNARVMSGDPNNGFLPLSKSASTVKGSNESLKFNVQDAKMPQPPSVVQPGAGGVPVNPFMGPGGSTSSLKLPDRPKK